MDLMFSMKNTLLLTVPAICLVMAACGGNKTSRAVPQNDAFPNVQVPAMIEEPQARMEYVAVHFWDSFADTSRTGLCDSVHVSGIPSETVEEAFGTYASLLGAVSPSVASEAVSGLVAQISACEAADTSSNVFETLSALAGKYLYDPNSPVRDEELYLPFAEGMAASPYVDEAGREKYLRAAAVCRMNRPGTVAEDFAYTDETGRRRHLYGTVSEYTLVIFADFGCKACRETKEALAEDETYNSLTASGRLAVLIVDPAEIPDSVYSLRAIPSIYLLDGEKKIILKDTTIEKLISELQKIG